jgi:hypothetical protein
VLATGAVLGYERITESGDERITETGAPRYTEGALPTGGIVTVAPSQDAEVFTPNVIGGQAVTINTTAVFEAAEAFTPRISGVLGAGTTCSTLTMPARLVYDMSCRADFLMPTRAGHWGLSPTPVLGILPSAVSTTADAFTPILVDATLFGTERITEEGDTRITEDGFVRIIEDSGINPVAVFQSAHSFIPVLVEGAAGARVTEDGATERITETGTERTTE